MRQDSSIFVVGNDTLITSAIVRVLKTQGYKNIIGETQPDFTHPGEVEALFASRPPEYVFLTGGKSGGIHANQHRPAELMLDNLLVQTHLINSAWRHGAKKLLYLASSCTYPRLCPQPMKVESLLTGPLEPTNEPYALAKLAGLKMCQAYRRQHGANFVAAISANPFGPGDDFDLKDSHVVPALIRKMHEAKEPNLPSVSVWGTGASRREFIFADDVADACIFLMQGYDQETPINIGSGSVVSIKELAELVGQVVGYPGKITFDTGKPDGMPFKILDSEPLFSLGWRPRVSLREGIEATYEWYLKTEISRVENAR